MTVVKDFRPTLSGGKDLPPLGKGMLDHLLIMDHCRRITHVINGDRPKVCELYGRDPIDLQKHSTPWLHSNSVWDFEVLHWLEERARFVYKGGLESPQFTSIESLQLPTFVLLY